MQRSGIGFIYKVTHVESGRVYIGQTTNKKGISARWSAHVSCSKRIGSVTYFHNAIRKHGFMAFEVSCIETCSANELNNREIYYISLYRSNVKGLGFNSSAGGDGGQNSITKETRDKISRSKKGIKLKPLSSETKAKISAANKGKRRTDQMKLNIRSGRKVTSLTKTWKQNISIGLKRTAKFSLSKAESDLIVDMLYMSDSKLADNFSVSRATIWKIRSGLYPIAKNYMGDDAEMYKQFNKEPTGD